MKIVVIGATGVIGSAVCKALTPSHQVISLSRHSTPAVQLEDPASVTALFRGLADIDAVISCAGSAAFRPVAQLTDEDFLMSFKNKLMGQVNVIRAALTKVRDGGSITVTSGTLAQNPMVGAGAVSLVNAGLEGFVRVAALEATRGIRVNVVSPPWVKETVEKMKMPPVPGSLSAADVARAYVASVEGKQTGETISPSAS